MTARKPKPVRAPMQSFRAFCPVLSDGGVPVIRGCVAMYTTRDEAKQECDLSGGRPVRVLVLPLDNLRRKATPEELARTHRSAVRVAKRVLRRDGFRVVPDGTPSAEAEVRRLRRALYAVRRLCQKASIVVPTTDSARMTFIVTQIDAALRGRRGR